MAVGLAAIDDFLGPSVPQAQVERVWTGYEHHVAQLAGQGAQLIVLPEKIAVLTPAAAMAVQGRFAAAAASARVWLVLGVGIDEGARSRNLAWLIGPDGTLRATYQKQHRRRANAVSMPAPVSRWSTSRGYQAGLAICKDMHFAELGLRYAHAGADLVLVPSRDFGADAVYAARLSALRGIESGFGMVRVAREGLLSVTDAHGRVLVRGALEPLPGTGVLAYLPPPGTTRTTFQTIGEGGGWLCVALAAAMLLFARADKRTQLNGAGLRARRTREPLV
ncbi:carbon-nitrogen hydrolase family protein [Massilia sp. Se16.2.3]|uniref:carbon-nitrogen hydrolase family protein n=1 Tax=Massilia sp. Se16.2.3 TaxID=2709303 RepID=UPI001601C76C|nr:carbon-nitrogen hydrolase family protein [Massilia sp. Se16.2.3]QNA97651.1 carbon-nitrogen hydrolase family protein [Massilia sp. Se16.2.3]